MKLIESKAEFLPQENGIEGIYKMIEVAGRTAYHSQDKITPTSAKDFVDRMINSKHGAALEHGTVYLALPMESIIPIEANGWGKYYKNPYSKSGIVCEVNREKKVAVITNYRVLVENNWLDDLQYLCPSTEFHEKRYTMRFTCSRAIANELVRHRTMSFLQESTRYINYSKERHGGEITCINNPNGQLFPTTYCLIDAYKYAEKAYFKLLENGCTPQQARDVLPNATKTELIMTGFSSDWRFLMDLRLFEKTGKVHPDMKNLMQKAQKAMQEAGIWDDIMSKPSKFEQYGSQNNLQK